MFLGLVAKALLRGNFGVQRKPQWMAFWTGLGTEIGTPCRYVDNRHRMDTEVTGEVLGLCQRYGAIGQLIAYFSDRPILQQSAPRPCVWVSP